jgi:hypothetical protein
MEYQSSESLGNLVRSKLHEVCPDEIQSYIGSDAILSGGSVVKILTNDYAPVHTETESPDVKEVLRKIYGINRVPWIEEHIIESSSVHGNDFDIYTNRDPESAASYFKEHGYTVKGFDEDDELSDPVNRVQPMYFSAYGCWMLRLEKIIPGRPMVSLDIMFTNLYKPVIRRSGRRRNSPGVVEVVPTIRREPLSSPQEFISVEFDLNICKVWFDGTVVGFPSSRILDDINARRMNFSFDPRMTINTHKRQTTSTRIIKYRGRGFSFIDTPENSIISWFPLFLYSSTYKCNKEEFNPVMGHCIEEIVNPARVFIRNAIITNNLISRKLENEEYPSYQNEGYVTSYEYKLLRKYYIDLARSGNFEGVDELNLPVKFVEFQRGFVLRFLAKNNPIKMEPVISKFIDKCIELRTDIGVNTYAYALTYILNHVLNIGYEEMSNISLESYRHVQRIFNPLPEEKKIKVINKICEHHGIITQRRYQEVIQILNEIMPTSMIQNFISRHISHLADGSYFGPDDYLSSPGYQRALEIMSPPRSPRTMVPQPIPIAQNQPRHASPIRRIELLIDSNTSLANNLAKEMILSGNLSSCTSLYDIFDINVFDRISSGSDNYGALFYLLTIALHGTRERPSKFLEINRRIKLAEVLASTRHLPTGIELCKNIDNDYITQKPFTEMPKKDYVIICTSYGGISNYYCITISTLLRYFNTTMDGQELYHTCDRDSNTAPDGVGAIIKRHELHIQLPLEIPILIDLYSFYKMLCLFLKNIDNESSIIAFLEMTSSGVYMYTEFGISSMHGAMGDDRNIFSLGRMLKQSPTSTVSISTKVDYTSDDLKFIGPTQEPDSKLNQDPALDESISSINSVPESVDSIVTINDLDGYPGYFIFSGENLRVVVNSNDEIVGRVDGHTIVQPGGEDIQDFAQRHELSIVNMPNELQNAHAQASLDETMNEIARGTLTRINIPGRSEFILTDDVNLFGQNDYVIAGLNYTIIGSVENGRIQPINANGRTFIARHGLRVNPFIEELRGFDVSALIQQMPVPVPRPVAINPIARPVSPPVIDTQELMITELEGHIGLFVTVSTEHPRIVLNSDYHVVGMYEDGVVMPLNEEARNYVESLGLELHIQ